MFNVTVAAPEIFLEISNVAPDPDPEEVPETPVYELSGSAETTLFGFVKLVSSPDTKETLDTAPVPSITTLNLASIPEPLVVYATLL